MLQQTNHDPLVSFPIVVGEYMRATGFLYRDDGSNHLVTARHNILPTTIKIPNPVTGGTIWEVNSEFAAETIDVFFHGSGRRIHHRISLNDVSENAVHTSNDVDMIAIQLPDRISPPTDLVKFGPADFQSPTRAGDTLAVYGWGGGSLPSPNTEYSPIVYSEKLQPPQELILDNPVSGENDKLANSRLGIALDSTKSSTAEYNGLSGAPVLGDGLAGVHSGTSDFPAAAVNQGAVSESDLKTHYFKSSVLSTLT